MAGDDAAHVCRDYIGRPARAAPESAVFGRGTARVPERYSAALVLDIEGGGSVGGETTGIAEYVRK